MDTLKVRKKEGSQDIYFIRKENLIGTILHREAQQYGLDIKDGGRHCSRPILNYKSVGNNNLSQYHRHNNKGPCYLLKPSKADSPNLKN